MQRGKEIAQGQHGSLSFLARRLRLIEDGQENRTYGCELTDEEIEWLFSESFTKIAVRVDSEAELMDIYNKAKAEGLEVHLITDSGKTVFNGVPTKTCLTIGPHEASRIDKITGHLEIY